MTLTTIHGDCTEVSSQICDGSIDLLLTDPPYNISDGGAVPVWIDKETGLNKNSIHNQKFDDSFEQNWDSVEHNEFLIQMNTWAKFWFSKIRPGGSFAVFISDQYISYLWKIMEDAGFEPKRIWTWKKPAAVPFNRQVNPVSACEYILWGIKPKGPRTFNSDAVQGTIVERYSTADKMSSILYRNIKTNLGTKSIDAIFAESLIEAKTMYNNLKKTDNIAHCIIPNTITYSGGLGKKIHPTEKPVELLEYFVALLSNPNDMILDTFAGSGSTGVAAYNSGRNCILIERDAKMFNLMQARIDSLNSNLFEVK